MSFPRIAVIMLVTLFFTNSLAIKLDLQLFGDCVIHLKCVSEDRESVDLAEEVLLSHRDGTPNQSPTLWTVDLSEKLQMPEPLINFYEPCSLHVLVDPFSSLYFSVRLVEMSRFRMNQKTTFIVIRDKTFVALISTLLIERLQDTSCRMYFAVVKFSESRNTPINWFMQCIFCSKNNKLFSINASLTTEIHNLRLSNLQNFWVKEETEIFVLSKTDIPSHDKCEEALWNLSYKQYEQICVGDWEYFAIEMVAKILNVSLVYTYSIHHANAKSSTPLTNRWIRVDGVSADFLVQANWSLIQKEVKGQSLVFCPLNISSSGKSSEGFRRWLLPFHWDVWLSLLLAVLAMLIPYVIILKDISLLGIFSHLVINIFGTTLRQPFGKLTIPLVTFSLGIMILMAYYEMNLTSELVVPTLEQPYTLARFISDGRRICIPVSKHNATELLEIQAFHAIYYDDFKRIGKEKLLNNSFRTFPSDEGFSGITEEQKMHNLIHVCLKHKHRSGDEFGITTPHSNEIETANAVSVISSIVGRNCKAVEEKLNLKSRFMAFLNPFHQSFAVGVAKFRQMGGPKMVKIRMGALRKIMQYSRTRYDKNKDNIRCNKIDSKNLQSIFNVLGIGWILSFIIFLRESGMKTAIVFRCLIPLIRKWHGKLAEL